MARLNITLAPELLVAIHTLAALEHRSVSNWVVYALTKAVRESTEIHGPEQKNTDKYALKPNNTTFTPKTPEEARLGISLTPPT